MNERRQRRATLITTADAAIAVGVSEQTIYSWNRRWPDLLPRHGTPRCALWDMNDLAEFLSSTRRVNRRVAARLPRHA